MRSPDNFIVQPLGGKQYDNVKSIGGVDFITSVSQEDHKVSNRFAVVVSTPINYDGPVEPGDTVVVHHNVFKFFYDMKGRQRSGKSFFMEDLFFLDQDQFFLYKRDGEWKAFGKYCFVQPVKEKDSFIFKGTKNEPLVGKIKYINQQLLDLGVNVGDEVSFQPDSEYEFLIDGQKTYRMFTKNITIVL